MFAFWWAWRSLHVGERLLLAFSLLVIAFCAGVTGQKYFYAQTSQTLLQQPPQSKLIQWHSGASIIVDVAGAVRHPGIVQLPRNSRVKDAIHKAGGVLSAANVSTLNLAGILSDGQQVRVDIPTQKSTFVADESSEAGLNINQATEIELQSLPDIGPVMAARIVAYRKAHGAFHDFDDLNAVKGIGVKTMEKLRPHITFH